MNSAAQPDPVDHLLQEMAQNFHPKTTHSPQNSPSAAMSKPDNHQPIDQALDELQNRFKPRADASAAPAPSAATDAVLADFQTQWAQMIAPSPPPSDRALDAALADFTPPLPQPRGNGPSSPALASSLDAIAQQFQNQPPPPPPVNLEQELQAQAVQLRQQKQATWEQQQRLMLLQRKAHEWLETLDPYSSEGIWFTDFARHYDSELAAAIDYLGSLLT